MNNQETIAEEANRLSSLKCKLIYARDFTPHKEGYYKQLIKEQQELITNLSTKINV